MGVFNEKRCNNTMYILFLFNFEVGQNTNIAFCFNNQK